MIGTENISKMVSDGWLKFGGLVAVCAVACAAFAAK